MKLLVISISLMVGACLADRLENTYLPPSHARHSGGGSGNFLAAPRRSSFGGTSFGGTSFGASGTFGGVGQSYGAPHRSGSGGGQSYHGGNQVPILRLNNDNDGIGSYRYE